MLSLQNISYIHPNKELLFENIHLTVSHQNKIALIGNNGTGKSTFLKITAGELRPAGGNIIAKSQPYYVPQLFGQYNQLTVGQALGIEEKLTALGNILSGNVTEAAYALLDDDWTIEERCKAALDYWQLAGVDLSKKLDTLSGGQKTKVFLAGISIHQPELILLDEPSNHLDSSSRQLLYQFVQSVQSSLIVVSHDRKLLSLLDSVCELNKKGLTVYGGNYQFYTEQKELQMAALQQDVQSTVKALRKAKEKQRETLERQQRLDSRGKGKQEKAGVAKIMMNTLRNKAENSTSKLKGVHADKINGLSQQLQDQRSGLPDLDKMRFEFEDSELHRGKVLFAAQHINFSYGKQHLWKNDLNFQVRSGERIVLRGDNGSGKTTLIRIVLGNLQPLTGTVYRATNKAVYIDQNYSLIDDALTVYAQAELFKTSALKEHDIKTRLNRFLFTKEDWDKPCQALSGGEKMRLLLCCLTIHQQSPSLIVLDEPTNNLDIQNVEILTRAVDEYRGTLLVVSHDEAFLEAINIGRTIQL